MKLRRHLTLLAAALFLVTTPGRAAPPAAVGHDVDAYLSALVPFGYWGAALIAIDGKVVLNRGYGWADAEKRVPNTPETLFGLQSVTKQFTAAAVLALQQDGRLDIDASIADYLPDVPPDKRGITLHQLLSHTSGVMAGTETRIDDFSRDSVIRTVLAEPLAFEPGSDFMYSNFGYELLAAIIENVSGLSYDEFVAARLFKPAGLTHTGHRPPDSTAVAAHWYAEGEDLGDPRMWPFPDWNSFGSGGTLTTTTDLFRWHEALLGDDVLSAASRRILYTPVLREYACGWTVRDSPHGTLIMHNGGSSNGSATLFARYVDANVTVILFCNHDGETMLFSERVASQVERIVFGEPVTTPPAVRPFEVRDRDALAGDYILRGETHIIIETGNNTLIARAFGQDAINALLQLRDPSREARAGVRAGEIFSAFAAGDTLPLFAAFSTPERGTRFVRYFERQRNTDEARMGTFRGYAVLGTVPDWITDVADVVTFLRADYEHDSRIFRLHWKDGAIAAVGGSGVAEPVRVQLLPGDHGTLVGYHIPTGQVVVIRPSPARRRTPQTLRLADGSEFRRERN
ncbi:MAG TPA: serine hydrolase domain-containing protein [Candidatus Krumholzibacteria bacterium]|nr:serine hydrolase domain-containing protein [Candidatus Krumholzibacteria bacterium]